MKTLGIREIDGAGVLGYEGHATEGACALIRGAVQLKRAGQSWIKGRDGSTDAESGGDQARRSRASAASAGCGAASAAALRASYAGRTASTGGRRTSRCSLHDSGVHTTRRLASVSQHDVGISDWQVVARDGDVEVIFQRQGNRVRK